MWVSDGGLREGRVYPLPSDRWAAGPGRRGRPGVGIPSWENGFKRLFDTE